jgi:hypothetical protein
MSTDLPRVPLRRAGLALLAAIVAVPNLAFWAIHGAIGGVSLVLGAVATLLDRAGLTPAAALADWMRRLRDRARDDRSAAATLLESAWAAVGGGRGAVRPRGWLSHTVLGNGMRLLVWPVRALVALAVAVSSVPPTRRWMAAAGRLTSRVIDRASLPGVLPGRTGALAAARTRWGFFVAMASGTRAILRNSEGMLGGCAALLLGDPDWLADAMYRMRGYAAYVEEKERHGELGPRSRMPFSRAMVRDALEIVEIYPADIVEAMRSHTFAEAMRACWTSRARVGRMIWLYFPYTIHTILVVSKFIKRGMFDAREAQAVILCEAAVMTSALSDDEKDAALADIQATAPSSIIEFEHYVGLVVPCDGTPAERAIRHSASGAPLDTHSVNLSIFDRHSICVAQSTHAEACALRTLLWLYRDEATARGVNGRETARKFGPPVAARLAEAPMFPLEPWEVEALAAGGVRPRLEVDAILLRSLRSRDLGAIAERVATLASPMLVNR